MLVEDLWELLVRIDDDPAFGTHLGPSCPRRAAGPQPNPPPGLTPVRLSQHTNTKLAEVGRVRGRGP